ncbi:MAG: replicative DNA helicase [Bacilli bacterium]|nr:replicative DNA helicase [Bacilli bacterium]
MAQEKQLPHNTEAEKAVLGAMIRSSSKVSEAVAKLDVEDFFPENKNHRAIFGAMYRLYNRGEVIDPQTITNELINSKELEISGAPEYLLELADAIVTFENFDSYVKIVQDQSILRRFLKTLDDISNTYYTKDINEISEFLSQSEKKITDVTEKRRIGDFQRADQVASKLDEELRNLKTATSDDTVTGTPTGYSKLNILTHGFQPGELIILAARPGVGKTALSLNLAYNAAAHDVPVAYFSLEMPATMLFKRLVSADANVKFDSLITGFGLNDSIRYKLGESCNRLAKRKIYIDDTSGIKLLDLVAKCRKLKAKEPDLGLIVVDYIGLVTTTTKTKSESRQLEVQMISQTLKKLALDLKVPILGVAQLNRNIEQRSGGDAEPQLSDLRESGSIEQDADIVLMLYEPKSSSENPQNNDGKPKNVFQKQDEKVNEAQKKVAGAGPDSKLVTLFVRKNRSGKQGKVQFLFRKDYCRFDTLSLEADEQVEKLDEERVQYMRRDS